MDCPSFQAAYVSTDGVGDGAAEAAPEEAGSGAAEGSAVQAVMSNAGTSAA
ncbi:hypothetical protein Pth03_25990 [Planotetraspora thailandica]|uniref:Uncharacterized protein n=1 Tax=Planotetraspora thailandica TaxID=487172 RepID=A0A8J3VBU5_9ACTN|nr:hypothetical protein Pth03_25990 [Planotetraspora thailandica]